MFKHKSASDVFMFCYLQISEVSGVPVSYVTRILVRVSDTIRIGYADTHFPKKH